MNIDKIVDQFIQTAFPDSHKLQGAQETPWVNEIEQKNPAKFPPSFRSLITRYRFPSFTVGPLQFFANLGTDDCEELKESIFRDQVLAPGPLKNRYIFFARPSDGSYDPICSHIGKRNKNDESEIVRLDHEEILQYDKIKIIEKIADSLLDFMQENIKT